MDSDARRNSTSSDRCLIPDLRRFTLEHLASRAAAGEKEVTDVVSRMVVSRESPSGVPAMMFTSAI